MKKRVKILIMLGATFLSFFGRISDNGAVFILCPMMNTVVDFQHDGRLPFRYPAFVFPVYLT